MTTMLKSTTALLALAALASCSKPKCGEDPMWRLDNDCIVVDPGADCAATICTHDFRGVPVTVLSANGNPVALDSFVVTDMNNVVLPPGTSDPVFNSPHNGYEGKYSVINDAWLGGHQNTTMSVRAKGWKSGSQLFDEVYVVGADCCHVYKQSGQDTIQLSGNW